MSSKNHEQKTRMTPYVRKASLNNNRRPCPDCKDTDNCVKSLSSKMNRIEEIVNNFYKNLPKNEASERFNANDLSNLTLEELQKLATFTTQHFNNNKRSSSDSSHKNDNNTKFIPNKVPCDLSNFTLEELQKLVNFTTQDFNHNNYKYSSSTSSNKK